MAENNQNPQSDFIIEKVKQRPMDKKKLFRKTMTTAFMAVIFGTIACVTFLLLEPIVSKRLYPEEEPILVTFPEDTEEMGPEDMLVEKIPEESVEQQPEIDTEGIIMDEVQTILNDYTLDKNSYQQMYSSLAEYVQELNRYMVTVTAISSNRDWFNNIQENRNQVSGVIITDNRVELLILTDASVLRRAESLVVTFHDGSQAEAELKKQDSATNLAVVAVKFADLPQDFDKERIQYPTLGSSNNSNMLGMPVVAMGSPLEINSIGYGMITASSAVYSVPERNYKILRTDIIGSQNPNGVLFDMEGRLIGIITGAKTGSDVKNVVYAYGITEMRKLLEKMSNDQPIAYLGITGITVPQEANTVLGVPLGGYVQGVVMDSPAMRAGIRQGDVISNVNGRSISTFNEYTNILMATEPGEEINMTIKRKGQEEYKEMQITMEAGETK